MTATSAVLNADDVRRAIHRMAHEIVEHHRGASDLVLVGIHTRGVTVAAALAEAIGSFEGSDVAQGELDIGLYRDDLDRRSGTRLARTHIPVDIGGKPLVLVDDVLFTGRTIRAALDALVDLGRASTIQLAVLVDRGHRQLPIRPDYVGKNLPTAADERVTVQMRPVDAETGVWIEKVQRT